MCVHGGEELVSAQGVPGTPGQCLGNASFSLQLWNGTVPLANDCGFWKAVASCFLSNILFFPELDGLWEFRKCVSS